MYMGADKFENEDLIKYGLPEDLWFHVDDMSSAHVYLRLKKNQKLEDVSSATIMECAQLVKANSIEGCKMREVKVVYTRWRNLKKTAAMEVGAIGYHDNSKVNSLWVVKDKETVKRLDKTKEIRFPNLAELQLERAAEFQAEKKAEKRNAVMQEKQAAKDRIKTAQEKSYADIMVSDNMKFNGDFEATVDDTAARNFEDDFM